MIDPSKWKISLPIYVPEAVLDNSIEQAHNNCPTLGLYKYGLRRGFEGKNWAIQYGTAYHKYRETVEKLMIASGIEGPDALTEEIHLASCKAAVKDWENPPLDHRHSYLTLKRLLTACELSKARIIQERKTGRIIVTRAEDSVDLEYTWKLCPVCCWTEWEDDRIECSKCGHVMVICRHGGRIDQFVIFSSLNGARMIRDFKTTGRMGKTYTEKFDPNAQVQGYVWDGGQLSGIPYDGALIETIYNTKSEGPTIHQHYVQYTKGQLERWEASRMIERQLIMTMYSRTEELGYLAFPQRTNHCDQYGGCSFREPCRASSAYEIETWLKNYTIESHWDFLSPGDEEGL